MSFLAYQQQATAIFYAILGRPAEATAINFFGNKLAKGGYKTTVDLAKAFINGKEGQSYYGKLSNDAALIKIYTNVYGSTPDAATLNQLKSAGTLEQVAANLVDNLFAYTGTAPNILAAQSQFNNKVNAALFPTTSPAVLSGAADIQAIFHLLGTLKTAEGINYWGGILTKKTHTATELVEKFIVNNKQSLLTDVDFINNIFKNGFERAATQTELTNYLDKLNSGQSRGDLVVDLIATLRGKVGTADQQAQQHFKNATYVFAQGELPPALYQEKAAIIYLAVLGRSIDASGLDTWSKYLYAGKSEATLINMLLKSSEYKTNHSSLSLTDYIQNVYTLLYDKPANEEYILKMASISDDRGLLTALIINDLRYPPAPTPTEDGWIPPLDKALVLQQHKYETAIANSLLYQKSATLTSSTNIGNSNPFGTVNNVNNHALSNAEIAALTDITLNTVGQKPYAYSDYYLRFADNLATLTINGDSYARVYLSNTGVSHDVNVNINNVNTSIYGSGSNYNYILGPDVDLNRVTLKLHVTGSNNNLLWDGNHGPGDINIAYGSVAASGLDLLSANFICKIQVVSLNKYGERNTDIRSNAEYFSFQTLDFGDYKGKALAYDDAIYNLDVKYTPVQENTFDWGLFTFNPSIEGIALEDTGYVHWWRPWGQDQYTYNPKLGLSSRADNVTVFNIEGSQSKYFKISGDATASSFITLKYAANAINEFVLQFTAKSSTDVNAGTLVLETVTEGNGPEKKSLDIISIESGGIGNFSNSVTFAGNNAQVKNIKASGDHILNLNLGAGLSNIRDIDASSNTAGFHLTTTHGGTGGGIVVQLLNLLPLNSTSQALLTPLLNQFGLNGYSLTVEGSQGSNSFNVVGNTTITGGAGSNGYYLNQSSAHAGVTITDFSVAKDTIFAGDLKLDGGAGFSVADYGTRSQELINAQLGGLVANLVGGVVELLAGILGVQNGGLTAKVGIASISFGSSTDSYLIIDNNGDHKLDADDTVIHLKNQDPKALLAQLHYNEITLNGVNTQQVYDAVAA